MDRAQKQQLTESLHQDLADTVCVVVTHQTGLIVAEVTQLRRQMRSAGARYRVTKNRLAQARPRRHAVRGAGAAVHRADRDRLLADPVAAAKAAVDYANRNDKLTIVGGGLAGQLLDEAGVRALATLPSLDELRGKLIGLLNAPATKLAVLLQTPGRPAGAGPGRACRAERRGASRPLDDRAKRRSRAAARPMPMPRFDASLTAQSGVATWLIWQGSSTICRR